MDRDDAIVILKSRPVASFGAAQRAAAKLISLDALIAGDAGNERLYGEICRIIADVYMHNPDRETVIDGEVTTYGYVQEIFCLLEAENVVAVVQALERYPREIRYKKAFVRTALYNTIFELETGAENEYAQDHPNFYGV